MEGRRCASKWRACRGPERSLVSRRRTRTTASPSRSISPRTSPCLVPWTVMAHTVGDSTRCSVASGWSDEIMMLLRRPSSFGLRKAAPAHHPREPPHQREGREEGAHLGVPRSRQVSGQQPDRLRVQRQHCRSQLSQGTSCCMACMVHGPLLTETLHGLQGHTLTTAWVGDSRGVLGRETPESGLHAVDLTEDHKPTNPGEKERILKTNGRVER